LIRRFTYHFQMSMEGQTFSRIILSRFSVLMTLTPKN
jgi:hypothetical protein